jgi:hypothetical protein
VAHGERVAMVVFVVIDGRQRLRATRDS